MTTHIASFALAGCLFFTLAAGSAPDDTAERLGKWREDLDYLYQEIEGSSSLKEIFKEQGRYAEAEPLVLNASASAEVLNGAAWTLLTVENESLRDPERALGFAQRACALAEEAGSDQLWAMLDTLALAQHRTGDTAAAVETQKRAIALMPAGADPEMAQRLAEYEAASKDR